MSPLFVKLPNVGGTKLFWVNASLICDIRPDGKNSQIWFSDGHAVIVGLTPFQVIGETIKAREKYDNHIARKVLSTINGMKCKRWNLKK